MICAPIYTSREGLSTWVEVGAGEGHELVSLPKTALTNFVAALPSQKRAELKQALRVALDIDD